MTDRIVTPNELIPDDLPRREVNRLRARRQDYIRRLFRDAIRMTPSIDDAILAVYISGLHHGMELSDK